MFYHHLRKRKDDQETKRLIQLDNSFYLLWKETPITFGEGTIISVKFAAKPANGNSCKSFAPRQRMKHVLTWWNHDAEEFVISLLLTKVIIKRLTAVELNSCQKYVLVLPEKLLKNFSDKILACLYWISKLKPTNDS